jgi:hypothetical protein
LRLALARGIILTEHEEFSLTWSLSWFISRFLVYRFILRIAVKLLPAGD